MLRKCHEFKYLQDFLRNLRKEKFVKSSLTKVYMTVDKVLHHVNIWLWKNQVK